MRILVATEQWYPDYVGGTARVVRDTAVALAARGHIVTVVAPQSAGQAAEALEDGVRVLRLIRRGRLPKTWTDPIRFRRALRRHMPGKDVVLAHHAAIATAVAFPSRLAPTVYVFHASPAREAKHRRRSGVVTLRQRLGSLSVEPVLVLCEHFAAAGADRIIVLSQFSKDLVVADHPHARDRVVVVGGGVDTDAFTVAIDRERLRAELGIRQDDRLLVTVRRLAPRMGVDNLLRALNQLANDDHINVRLLVIGDGELRERLEALARGLGLSQHVEFLGQIDDDRVRRLYQAADVFVLPTVAYEGFGMATVEALASGTPVVGTPIGATPELLSSVDPTLLADDASPGALVSAIEKALPRAGVLRAACRRHAERSLSWTTVIQNWEGELVDVVREDSSVSAR